MNELEAFNMVKVMGLILLPYICTSLEQSPVKFYVEVDCLTPWYAISKNKAVPPPILWSVSYSKTILGVSKVIK